MLLVGSPSTNSKSARAPATMRPLSVRLKHRNKTILADLTPEERSMVVDANYKIKLAAIAADIQDEIKQLK
jgi:hypothetical protein